MLATLLLMVSTVLRVCNGKLQKREEGEAALQGEGRCRPARERTNAKQSGVGEAETIKRYRHRIQHFKRMLVSRGASNT